MSIYGDIAEELVDSEFPHLTGSEYTGEILYVSGWLGSHLGDLNILLNTNFSGTTGELQDEEESIFKHLYLVNYYKKKTRDTLRGIDESVDWQSIQEGDSRITRTNKNEVAKTWKGLAVDTKLELDELVAKYNIYEASPVQVYDVEA
jgi:hypothetical protein